MTGRIGLGILLMWAAANSALAAPPREADPGWRLGMMLVSVRQDDFDVFAREDLPPAVVDQSGLGGGLQIGYRFGGRFVLDLQAVFSRHDIAGSDDEMVAAWGLFTGTVLFRPGHTWQPFLRGGFGGGSLNLARPGDDNVFSFGTGTLAGAGVMCRLGRRLSLELEAAATFTNHLEVHNEDSTRDDDEQWPVRASSRAWRVGAGLSFWF